MAVPPRVVLIDDRDMFRTGLAKLLGDAGVNVVGSTSTSGHPRELVRTARPDVIVIDPQSADGDNDGLLVALRKDAGDVPVLVLTAALGELDVAAALRAGVRGYLAKATPIEQLVSAITAVRERRTALGPEAAALACRFIESGHAPVRRIPGGLSDREVEVLRLVARGWENDRIAEELTVSPLTEPPRSHLPQA